MSQKVEKRCKKISTNIHFFAHIQKKGSKTGFCKNSKITKIDQGAKKCGKNKGFFKTGGLAESRLENGYRGFGKNVKCAVEKVLSKKCKNSPFFSIDF